MHYLNDNRGAMTSMIKFRFTTGTRLSKFLGLAVLILPALLLAQTGTATLSGRVTDKTGAVVQGAEVEATAVATNRSFKRVTNDDGLYTVPALVPGIYNLVIRKTGFKESTVSGLVLNVDGAVNQNAILQAGSTNETVTVEAESQGLNTSSATVGTVIDQHLVENLPLNGRSFQSLIELTPGVVPTPASFGSQGQFSVNGQRSDSNYFTIDGVGANFGGSAGGTLVNGSGNLPTVSAQGGTNSLVSVDAMQEFRVQTSGYAPEFGRSPGGQVSITTKPGTNKFHGNLFEYFRNDAFDANNWFGDELHLKKPALRQNDFGGTLGGPIWRDKTFFFFSYEGLRLKVPQIEQGLVPTLAARAAAPPAIAPLLNAFPQPNGPDLTDGSMLAPFNSSFSNPAKLDSYSIRIDQSLGNKLQLFGRFVNAPSSDTIRGAVDQGFSANTVLPQEFSTRSLTLGLTWQISNAITNELRYGYGTTGNKFNIHLDTFGGAVVPPDSALFSPSVPFSTKNAEFEFADLTGFNTSFVTGQNTDDTQTQHNVIDNLTVTKGAHDLKFGVDYRRLSPVFDPAHYVAAPLFLDIPSAIADSPFLTIVGSIRPANVYFHNLGAFAQDNWKATPRLTLTYGLRWDIDRTPSFDHGLNILSVTGFGNPANLALQPAGTPPYANTYGNFAPRIGINYQVHQNPGYETVLRGGYGIFYDLASSAIGNGIIANGFPFGHQNRFPGPALGGTTIFPLTPAEAAPPAITLTPPLNFATIIDPHLKLPYSHQFNVSMEQALGRTQAFSISYVGARGERLLQTEEGTGAVNATFNSPILYDNRGFSNYNALQVQFRRRLDTGLQVLASYTWSHSIDSGSSSSGAGNDDTLILGEGPSANKGDSDFDLRHSASFAFTYDAPQLQGNFLKRTVLGNWSADTIALLYSAPPVTPLATALQFVNFQGTLRADRVPGVPVYLFGGQYPGGKRINPAAFQNPPVGPGGDPIREGTQGRNALRGFGVAQWDFAFHRDFPLKDQLHLQFRAEMFNIINHPNFGPVNINISSQRFGLAQQTLNNSLGSGGINGGFNPLFQIGGPRSIQLALKLNF